MVPYESWIDRQIREATERGAFDNLPGAGQPIAGLNGREDENWWVKGLLERENIKPVLPTALALRKEVEDLPNTLADVATENAVREIVTDLNARIVEARRRRVDDAPVLVRTADLDAVLAAWRKRRGV